MFSCFGLRCHCPEEFSHDAERALVQMQEVYLKSTFDKVLHSPAVIFLVCLSLRKQPTFGDVTTGSTQNGKLVVASQSVACFLRLGLLSLAPLN